MGPDETLYQDAAARAARYLTDMKTRSVAPEPEALSRLAELAGPTPEAPTNPEEVLQMLDEVGSPGTMGNAGPRYFGLVVGGSLPATVAASWLATTWDQNSYSSASSPLAAALEETCLTWLTDILGLPDDCGGALVTGATMASFAGLAAARHVQLARAGWDVKSDGLFGAPEVTVVVGAEVHPSAVKALTMLGFGRARFIEVPVDSQGRMRADALPEINGPAIICAQAGNVNSGASDPFDAISDWAEQTGAWVHVDGAFGLWAAAAPDRKHLIHGYERADSWSTDGHKWLNVPYDSGIALVKDADALRAPMSISAAYLQRSDERRDPAEYSPELSRRARGVEIWAALKSLGRNGVAELVERCCRHASRFANGLTEAGYEVLNEVALNQVLVSFGDAETTQRAIAAIQEDGTCWCGGTVWQGHTAMRISVSSWATTQEDVERSLEAMIRCARSVS
jgi:glutamate/tyrosine decarboxylase-like PLP-dependent enzyme